MPEADPRATGSARRAGAGLLVLCAAVLAAQDPEARSPLAGTGPMRQLLARGVAAAPMTTGLSFAITITNRGAQTTDRPWLIRVPGASPLTLSIEEPQWDSESFTALATIRNTTGNYAGGLRLEFLEVTEGSRRRTISLDSPLFFGDLESGGEASLPFRLDGLGLSGEAPLVLLRGIVTGAVASASVELPDSAAPSAIDARTGGALCVGDESGKAIFRITADLGSIRRFDAGCPVTGLAVRRKSGEVLASCREAAALVRLAPSGKLTRSDPLDRPLGRIRFGGKDDLYGAPGTIVRLEGLSVAEEFGRGSPAPP